MTAFPAAGLRFLSDLEANNEKEWFHANKKRYERELKAPARELAAIVNAGLAELAPEFAREKPEKAINRINRDIRFSKDKTPYNTHVWAGFHDNDAPKGSAVGLYFGLSPTGFGVGGGAWKPDPAAMTRLRETLATDHAAFRAIVEKSSFKSTFGEVAGDAYKRVPKPWTADHPAAELLKLKGVHVRSDNDPAGITRDDFTDVMLAQMRQLMPFIRFLQAGLRG